MEEDKELTIKETDLEEKYKRIELARADVISKMQERKVYSASYTHSIEVLARTLVDYEDAIKLFDDRGGKVIVEYTNKAGATNMIKNPLYLAIEKLRTDIVAFSKELGLSPSSKIPEGKVKDETDALMRFIK